MQVTAVPEAKMLRDGVYVVVLWGTAMLSDQARGWVKTAGDWRSLPSVPGTNLMLEIPRAMPEDARGTLFEAAIYRNDAGPGRGEALWSGRYWVRPAPEGPMLAKGG